MANASPKVHRVPPCPGNIRAATCIYMPPTPKPQDKAPLPEVISTVVNS
jgi:hypothetical protein